MAREKKTSDQDIKTVVMILKQVKGIDLSGYRSDLILQHIAARMTSLQIAEPRPYLQLIKENQGEK